MSDPKATPQALVYSMIIEQAKNTAENNLLLRAILEELQELNGLLTQAPVSSLSPEAQAAALASAAATGAAIGAATPSGGGMESVLEQMICEEMGVSPEMLRTGKLDATALRAFLKNKKESASPTPPT